MPIRAEGLHFIVSSLRTLMSSDWLSFFAVGAGILVTLGLVGLESEPCKLQKLDKSLTICLIKYYPGFTNFWCSFHNVPSFFHMGSLHGVATSDQG